ncbi:hypothetical protein [Methyloraptor flagellatus]|uniref:Uncharacterized protein n=1 Tax=Methyloraptor flagellatus TaxID=3162530 RepID=A0AAU7XDB7_9HYPH
MPRNGSGRVPNGEVIGGSPSTGLPSGRLRAARVARSKRFELIGGAVGRHRRIGRHERPADVLGERLRPRLAGFRVRNAETEPADDAFDAPRVRLGRARDRLGRLHLRAGDQIELVFDRGNSRRRIAHRVRGMRGADQRR